MATVAPGTPFLMVLFGTATPPSQALCLHSRLSQLPRESAPLRLLPCSAGAGVMSAGARTPACSSQLPHNAAPCRALPMERTTPTPNAQTDKLRLGERAWPRVTRENPEPTACWLIPTPGIRRCGPDPLPASTPAPGDGAPGMALGQGRQQPGGAGSEVSARGPRACRLRLREPPVQTHR